MSNSRTVSSASRWALAFTCFFNQCCRAFLRSFFELAFASGGLGASFFLYCRTVWAKQPSLKHCPHIGVVEICALLFLHLDSVSTRAALSLAGLQCFAGVFVLGFNILGIVFVSQICLCSALPQVSRPYESSSASMCRLWPSGASYLRALEARHA